MILLSIDLDGTLLNSSHQISQKNLEAVKRAKDLGIEVVLNTGRDLEEILVFPELENLNTGLICMNGTRVYGKKHQLLSQYPMKKNDYQKVLEILKNYPIYIESYTSGGIIAERTEFMPEYIKDKQRKVQSYKDVLKEKEVVIYKVLTHGEHEVLKEAKEAVLKNLSVNAFFSYNDWMEVTDFHANKGKGIFEYIKLNNLDIKKIYTIGDGGNDLDQFSVSTMSAAMKNAPDYVKEKASTLTKTNDEDGVAYAIEHIFKLI